MTCDKSMLESICLACPVSGCVCMCDTDGAIPYFFTAASRSHVCWPHFWKNESKTTERSGSSRRSRGWRIYTSIKVLHWSGTRFRQRCATCTGRFMEEKENKGSRETDDKRPSYPLMPSVITSFILHANTFMYILKPKRYFFSHIGSWADAAPTCDVIFFCRKRFVCCFKKGSVFAPNRGWNSIQLVLDFLSCTCFRFNFYFEVFFDIVFSFIYKFNVCHFFLKRKKRKVWSKKWNSFKWELSSSCFLQKGAYIYPQWGLVTVAKQTKTENLADEETIKT